MMRKGEWWDIAKFGVLGVLIHGLGLWVFMIASKNAPALELKLSIIGITGVAAVVLLWFAIRKHGTIWSAIICSAILALDFELAFHLLGLLGFGGLLRDATSFEYALSLLKAIGAIFMIYLLPSLALQLLMGRRKPSASS
jgi:hypothetical protein